MTIESGNKLFLRAFRNEATERPPFWLMRQAGRYLPEYLEVRATTSSFLEFCYTPEKAVEVTLQPLRRYNFDAAILFCDILVIPDALGQKVEFVKGEGPQLEPIRDVEGLKKLSLDHLHSHLAPVYETVSRLSKEIPETTTLIGFAGAPWTVATYMVEGRGGTDYGNIKSWAADRPEEFSQLMDMLVEATTAYLIEQVRHGAEVIQMFDTWAGVLEGDQYEKWVIAPTKRIVDGIKAQFPDVPVIGFPKGSGELYEAYVEKTGVDGVGLDMDVDLDWAAEKLQPKCLVQGNLDNQLLVKGGPEMEERIKTILTKLGNGPFIFNLGHGIVPETPPENVARLAEIVHNWGK